MLKSYSFSSGVQSSPYLCFSLYFVPFLSAEQTLNGMCQTPADVIYYIKHLHVHFMFKKTVVFQET